MKYITILCDGMADYPVSELGGRTPLMAASKPNIDMLAKHGEIGLIQTVPPSQSPGSDNTNLSLMGYDPLLYYTGRSPLEAASIGIDFTPEDVTYRCNLVTLSNEPSISDRTMVDYSSGEITTAEAQELIETLATEFNDESIQLYAGVSYRHCLVLRSGSTGADTTPPHDITNQPIRDCLPKGENSQLLLSLMERSCEILRDHPVNASRISRKLNPATCCWFWGEGRKASLPPFSEMTGLSGAVISAVDLIKGIAVCAEMDSIDVPGATGTIDTNFDGKAAAAIEALKTHDFLYLHMEAPDECGHQGNAPEKTRAIELIDQKVVGPIYDALNVSGEDFVIAILPDHRTPIEKRTHTRDAVPYLIYRSFEDRQGDVYNEDTAAKSSAFIERGCDFLPHMMKRSL